MRLDQLNGLTAFLKVAETKSFARAAIELGVAPASLSEAVKALETRLGVRLLNRTTRSVGLTCAAITTCCERRRANRAPCWHVEVDQILHVCQKVKQVSAAGDSSRGDECRGVAETGN